MADRDIANREADYQTDIAHLLPAEITAFYISVKGIIPFTQTDTPLNQYYLIMSVLFALILAGLFYVIMPQMLRISGKSQRILYLLTFLVWILSIDIDHIVALMESVQSIPKSAPVISRVAINLFVALWSFSVPFIFRRFNPPPSPAVPDQPPANGPP